jgi:hypothetical protein
LRKKRQVLFKLLLTNLYKAMQWGWVQWLILIIPVTQQAEIGKIMAQGKLRQKVSEAPYQYISWMWW